MAEGGKHPEDLSNTLRGGSEFCFDFYCYPCDEDGRNVEAVGFCTDCSDYLCEECYKSHHRPKLWRHHVLLDSQHMPKDSSSSRKAVSLDRCTETCQKHSDKVIEYYCHEHDTLACSTCAFADHRNCRNVDHIPDVADKICEHEEYSNTKDELHNLENKASRILQTSKDNISVSAKCCDDAIDAVATYKKEIYDTLEKLEKALQTDANTLHSENKNRLLASSSKCKSVLAEVKGTLQSISKLEKSKQYCNLFVALKKSKRILISVEKQLDKTEHDSVLRDFKFEPNVQTQTSVCQPDGLGCISVSQFPADTGDTANDDRGSSRHSGESMDIPSAISAGVDVPEKDLGPKPSGVMDNKTINAKHITDINVKHDSDQSPCWIEGVVLMPNDKLVALDYTNKNVKVVDTCTQKVLSVWALESKPWNGTSAGNDKLAVTLPFDKTVQIFNVSTKGSISVSKSMKTSGSCRGIAYAGNMLWVSYNTTPPKVEALTVDGAVQHSITADVTGIHNVVASEYLAVSPDCDSIYLSGYSSKGIVRMSNTGKVLSDYKCEDSAYIWGLHMAADGTLYVCDGAGNVFMLSARSDKLKKVIDSSQIPNAVCGLTYDENTCKIYLGPRYGEKITVVKLS